MGLCPLNDISSGSIQGQITRGWPLAAIRYDTE
jgi:hypothetical protein